MLAFDTCFDVCSVAVADFSLDGIMLRADTRAPMATGHAEALPVMIRQTLAQWGKTTRDVTLIAVTHGPGTFAGTRIGIAVARGLALALAKPAIGLSSLHAIAVPVIAALSVADRGVSTVVVAVDARRGQLYLQTVDGDYRPLDEPHLTDAASAAARLPAGRVVVVGSGSHQLVAAAVVLGRTDVAAASADPLPDARSVAILGSKLRSGGPVGDQPPRPLYLRGADVTIAGAAKASTLHPSAGS